MPLRRSLLSPHRTIVRFGSLTSTANVFPRAVELGRRIIEINTAEAIKISRDKLLMKQCFDDAEIAHSKWKPANDFNLGDLEYPILAKNRLSYQGRGMVKIDNQEQYEAFKRSHNLDAYILERYYNYAREYRLHCTQEECFLTWRKLRRHDAEERWFFNSHNCNWVGENHRLFNKPRNWEEIIKASINAIKAVGLDIGAVDCRVAADGKFIILEVNSAPALGAQGLQCYQNQIKQLIHAQN